MPSHKKIIVTVFFLLFSLSVLAQIKDQPDSIKAPAYLKYNKASKVYRAFFGENYRKIWGEPVKMKILYLDKEKGGLKITGTGGGNQTKSLKLKDSAGNQWALRTVEKFPERALPKYEKNTIIQDVLKDAVTTSHPYAALVAPVMEDALDIPHANPEVVYLADQPTLGQYRKDFANHVYLLEEGEPAEGEKQYKTEKLQDKLEKDNDSQADQVLLLRARLLDMIMGDWDRHGDQWRWQKEGDSSNLYSPIPRDRDKIFYSTGGVFPGIAGITIPQLQSYHDRIRLAYEWNMNAIQFDTYFLNKLSEADWKKQIAYVQEHLTDEVIERAMHRLPPNVYAISGKRLTGILIARRNNITEYGISYYKELAKDVDIPASDKNERFTINEQANGMVNVTINKIKKDSTIGKPIYQRTFDPKVTREVRLYGLGGKDVFNATGQAASKIKVRMIGGADEDTFLVDSTLQNRSKLYVYDRSDEKNVIPGSNQVRLRTSTDTGVNQFKRDNYKYDLIIPKVGLGYNTEDGLSVVLGFATVKNAFREDPYAFRQDFTASYRLSKQAYIFEYRADITHLFANNGLSIYLLSRGPHNVNNFFGIGNNVQFPNEAPKTFDYYRNRYDITFFDVRLYQPVGRWKFSEGLLSQYYTSKAENNQDHFFSEYDQQHPELNLFSQKFYAGVVLGVDYEKRNNGFYPSKGYYWTTKVSGLTGLNVSDHTNASIVSTFNFYLNFGEDSKFVIADRTGAGLFFGTGEFFQMMNLGGPLSLQGYHTSRFIGDQILFNNLELRIKLFDFNNYIMAGKFGAIAYNDVGRVWLNGESSQTVHDAFGGGFFIAPYNKVILSAVLGHSITDGQLLYLAAGFRF